jgi:type II secretory ATPase GspE/PulE/Tfp pilus assembly ATPase PilB-like protein
MTRPSARLALLALLGLCSPAIAQAAGTETWLLAQSASVPRGPGLYLDLIKFIPVVLLYLLWVKTTHWVEADTKELNNVRYEMWNSIVFFAGILGFALLFLIPIYVLGLAMLVVAILAPLFSYVHVRNQMVGEYDKVMTPYHLGEVMNDVLARFGVRRVFNKDDDGVDRTGPPVFFLGKSAGGGNEDPSRVEKAEESEYYFGAKQLIYDAVTRRATDIHLEPAGETTQVRYRIDGILHAAEPFDRPSGDAMVNIFKVLSAMDIAERRKPQDGSFAAKVDAREVDFRVATSGSKGGEKMVIRILDNKATVSKLDEVGMRPRMAAQVRELLALPNGLILIAGPTGSGKTTTLYACLRDIDRFLRNVVSVEDPIEFQIENVTQNEINVKAGDNFADKLRSVLRQDPDVIMIGEIRDEETAAISCQAAMTGHLVLTTLHATDAFTALRRMRDLKVEPATLAQSLSAIIAQRLVRVLCEDCKEPYKPNPEFLRKANLPPDKVDLLYRTPEAPEQICPTCGGTGYLGRTGIFELLVVNDAIRELIRSDASENAIKAEARKNNMIYLLEDGLRQVIQGKTAIKELQRVV